MAKKPTIESIDASLKRWKTRLKRAVSTIDRLEKQRKRLEMKTRGEHRDTSGRQGARPARPVSPPQAQAAEVEKRQDTIGRAAEPRQATVKAEPARDDLGIPEFLRRQAPDPAIEQIREEQAAIKTAKARGRIEKMKAKQRGDLKKMPLSGRAALDHIRNSG